MIIVEATKKHGIEALMRMRQEIPVNPVEYKEAIVRGMKESVVCYAALRTISTPGVEPYHSIVALWGFQADSLVSDKVYMWLMTTPEIEHCRVEFLRRSVRLRDQIHRRYRTIEGHVLDSFEQSKQWLRWLGFTVHTPVPTPTGVGVCHFERTV